jgi:mono/diheme cytochrome c family protein
MISVEVKKVRTLLLVLAIGLASPASAAELTPAEKTIAKKLSLLVGEARVKYQAEDYGASGKAVSDAIDLIDSAMKEGRAELYDALQPSFAVITKASALLELEGAPVKPFAAPARPDPVAKVSPPKPSKTSAEPAKPAMTSETANPFSAAMESISFVKQVAPILVQQCGRCHIAGTKGNFNMATFRDLAKGPPEGTVIFPGDVAGSRLIETIETGDMPRGGKMPADQLKVLKDWIAGGAKYDGPSPDAPLMSMTNAQTPAATPAPTPVATVKRATGRETVSFAKDIAPILLKNCNGCHIDAMRDQGGLRMDTFAQILRGGDSGAIVEGGKPATSLLIRKLRGQEGNRMPAGGRPALSEESITLISRWIEEGSVLDGENENQPLGIMSALAWAKSATDQELSERRANLAKENLQLVTGAPPRSNAITTDRFSVLGDVGEGTLKAVADAAEKAWTEIKPWVEVDRVRGHITIFVVSKRYDYSEFARMVEQRSIPSDWQSHWRYDGIDAYVAMIAASEDKDDALKAKLIAPLASLSVAMRAGGIPRWLPEGVGRFTASKVVGRDLPAVEQWNRELPSAIAAMKDGVQFTKNELPPEQSDLIAYGLANAMMSRTQRRQYDALLRALPDAKTFDAAFSQAFGMNPATYITQFKQYAAGSPGPRRN